MKVYHSYILTGIGFCMAYMSSLIVVGLYFNKKRAIATGIATSGSGLGTFAYAYFTSILLDMYDWKGTVLILSAVLLHGVAAGAVYRPLQRAIRSSKQSSVETLPDKVDIKLEDELGKLIPANIDSDNRYAKDIHKFDRVNYLKYNEIPRYDELPHRLTVSTEDMQNISREKFTEVNKPRLYSSQRDFRNVGIGDHIKHDTNHHSSRQLLKPILRKDIFYSGSLARLPHAASNIDTEELESEDTTEIESFPEDSSKLLKSRLRKTFITHFSLFKEKTFVLLLLVNVFWTGNNFLVLAHNEI